MGMATDYKYNFTELKKKTEWPVSHLENLRPPATARDCLLTSLSVFALGWQGFSADFPGNHIWAATPKLTSRVATR